MTTERETTRIVRSWLQTDEHESASQVVATVLDRLDTTPQRRPWWAAWRTTFMNGTFKFAAAALAVVVVATIGLAVYFSRPAGPAATSTPISSSPPTSVPQSNPAVVPATDSPIDPSVTPQPSSTGDHAPWVVFTRGDGRTGTPDDLWAMRIDGTDAHEILSSLDFPNIAWSQDGSRLLVADANASGSSRVYLSEVSDDMGPLVDMGFGTGAETACNDKSREPFPCQDWGLSFAPDEQRVVLLQTCTYIIPGCGFLTILDLRTGELTELTETLQKGRHGGPIGNPVWSPDGSMFAFTSETNPRNQDVVPESNLYLVNADGTNLHKVDLAVPRLTSPQWSPDGTTLALVSDVWLGDEWQGANIYTVRADGTNLRQLTTDGQSYSPEWTLSGQIRFRNGNESQPSMAFSLMDADGSNVVQLANMETLLGSLPPSGSVGEYAVPGYPGLEFYWQPSE